MLMAKDGFAKAMHCGESISAASGDELYDTFTELKEKIKSILPKYWMPKLFYLCDEIPHTETGKIARKEVYDLVSTLSPIV